MDEKQKRIAKNTILLYIRTLVTMCISLYTSRVVLDVLGVQDYGIYNVVGGMVIMFSVITNSLTTAINRFFSYDLGCNNFEHLKIVFSTSVSIQLLLSLVILIIGETIGSWFLNYHLVIPEERIFAAHWVLHCTLLTFILNLISVPYNACLIAHEHMNAFAYIGILESILKLLFVFMLMAAPIDALIYYAILQVGVALIIRLIYGLYCKRKFIECNYHMILDKKLFKEMSKLAGWSFFSNAFYILNTQGVNILINIYFGVAVNAARGIATQVEGAIMTFIKNFITAINPQIIKAYASGDKQYLNNLIINGAKYTYYMALAFIIPFAMETEFIMGLWLKDVPDYAVLFVRLSFIYSIIDSIGNTGYFACVATGNMKLYTQRLTTIGCLIFPITWLFFELGSPVEYIYIISGTIAFICLFLRLFILKKLIDFNPIDFIKGMIIPAFIVTIPVILLPFIILNKMDEGLSRFLTTIIVSESVLISAIFIGGIKSAERAQILSHLQHLIQKRTK